jgi:hypothetical protein
MQGKRKAGVADLDGVIELSVAILWRFFGPAKRVNASALPAYPFDLFAGRLQH